MIMYEQTINWIYEQSPEEVTNKLRRLITLDNWKKDMSKEFVVFFQSLSTREKNNLDPSVLIYSKNPSHFALLGDEVAQEWNELSSQDKRNPIYQYIMLKIGKLSFKDVFFVKPDIAEFINTDNKSIELIYKFLILMDYGTEKDDKYFDDIIPLLEGIGVYYTHDYQLENVLLIINLLDGLGIESTNLESLKEFIDLQIRSNGAVGYINPLNSTQVSSESQLESFYFPNTFAFLNSSLSETYDSKSE